MLRALAIVPLFVLAGCGGHGGSPVIGSTSSVPPAGGPMVVPAPEEGPPPEETLDRIADNASTDATCFAWSPAGAAMCDVEQSSIQGGAMFEIRVLGPAAESFPYYRSPEGEQFFDVTPAQMDRAALARAKAVAKAGGFRGWTGKPAVDVPIGETAVIGDFSLRRTRTVIGQEGDDLTGSWDVARDTIELQCGARWVPLRFDSDAVFGNSVGEPEIQVVLLGGKLLFTGAVSWGIEGDHGGGTDAALIDPKQVCR